MVKRRRQSTPSQKTTSMGQVRIISGLWRGRKLPVHDAEGLRPTTDRVRETLFNWLAFELPHARCLDLFAGSGALGFEAASRQASHVTMIELNKTTFNQLEKNRQTLNTEAISLVNQDAQSFLATPTQTEPYDVVFIDPPFRKELLSETCRLLEEQNWLSPEALIYVESEKEWAEAGIPSRWMLEKEKVAGQVAYRLYKRQAE